MDGNITLIVKAANQSVPDHRLECDADWTILRVKDFISTAHPSKPKVEEQRLIYSGQLLLDDLQLRNVLRHPTENNAYTIHLVCSPPRHASPNQPASAPARQPQTLQQQQPSPRRASASSTPAMAAPQQEAASAAAPSVPYHPVSSDGESTEGLRRRNVNVGSNDAASVATPQGIEAAAGYPTQAQVTMSVLQATADPIQQMATMQQMYANYMAYMQYIQMGGGMPWPQQMLHHIPASPSNPSPAAQAAATPSAVATDPADQQPQAQLAGEQNGAANPQQQQQQQQQQQPQIRMNAQGGEVEDDDENEGLGRDWLDWIYVLSRMVVLLSVVYFYSTISRFMIVICIALLLYLYQAGWFRPTRRVPPELPQPAPQQQQQAREGNENEMDDGPDDRNNNINNNNNNNEVPDQLVMENQEEQQQENNAGGGAEVTDRGMEADDLHVRPSLLALSWTFLTTFFTSLIPEQPQVI